jgi:predicted DNA-binding antitoxin AbrB/MazE fold protein
METTLTAIYENGVLRPLTPLTLPEHAEVEISIRTHMPDAAEAEIHRRRVREALVAAGLMLTRGAISATTEGLLSEDARHALAQQIPAGRPLSEIIREEREGR